MDDAIDLFKGSKMRINRNVTKSLGSFFYNNGPKVMISYSYIKISDILISKKSKNWLMLSLMATLLNIYASKSKVLTVHKHSKSRKVFFGFHRMQGGTDHSYYYFITIEGNKTILK